MHEEIIDKHRGANLKVYAVWFEMIWTDSRERIPDGVLNAPGVLHFWDDEKIAGRWYEENVTRRGEPVEWDAYFLYAPDASWGEEPPEVAAWGRTILSTKERLQEALQPLVTERPPALKEGKPDG